MNLCYVLDAMSLGLQYYNKKAVLDRLEHYTVGHAVDSCSQFPISGRRTLLLSGKNSRKSSVICCLVNMPWTTVSLVFCFY